MSRPIRPFTERMADAERRKALGTLTLTERLLAHVLIELMETRGRNGQAGLTKRLRHVGLNTKQIAALLDTTPESLAVAEARRRRKSDDSERP